MANAFAAVSLPKVLEFHLSLGNTDAPNCPYQSLLQSRTPTNRTEVLYHYSMLTYSSRPCFEHSIFLKVNEPFPDATKLMVARIPAGCTRSQAKTRKAHDPPSQRRNPTTSFLTATTLVYAIGAGITAAAGTRLALQLFLVKMFKLYSFQLVSHIVKLLLFLVTTSLCQDWVICAPAAFLRSGSRFSGSLSGIEP